MGWVNRATELAVEMLSDDELLALCDSEMHEGQQKELSELLDLQHERTLHAAQRDRLEELMSQYRRGLVRKAHALKEAVARGLRPRLG